MRRAVTSTKRDSSTGRAVAGRSRIVLATTLVVLSLLAPAAAQAGGPAFTFWVSLGSGCPEGTGPASSTITLTLMDRDNNFIDSQTVYTDGSGLWTSDDCFWFPINGGDKIRAESGPYSRTFQVPNLTININRVSDVISGKAPTTGSFHLYTTVCESYQCSSGPDVNVNVASGGTYARDFTALHNLIGGDRAFGRWTSPSGDNVETFQRYAPRMEFVIGDRNVDGQGKPNQTVTVKLKTAGGTLIGSGSDATNSRNTNFRVELKNSSGEPVYPRVGNKATSNIASDASLTVPTITLAMADADTVSGHCFNNGQVYVYLEHYYPSYDWTDGYTSSNSSGNFSIDIANMSNTSFVPAAGDRYEVDCHNAKGDIVARYAHY